jgi:hypothetical protein
VYFVFATGRGRIEKVGFGLFGASRIRVAAAADTLRGFIDAIVLTPQQGELKIELQGNLAAMLKAARRRAPIRRWRHLDVGKKRGRRVMTTSCR